MERERGKGVPECIMTIILLSNMNSLVAAAVVGGSDGGGSPIAMKKREANI